MDGFREADDQSLTGYQRFRNLQTVVDGDEGQGDSVFLSQRKEGISRCYNVNDHRLLHQSHKVGVGPADNAFVTHHIPVAVLVDDSEPRP